MDGLTIGYLAERNARKRPDREALVLRQGSERGEALTFRALSARVDRAANGLADRGIGKGDRVAVYMGNNVETLEIYLAALKLGALPVPINHLFQAREVQYVLANSGARVLVFDELGAGHVTDVRDHPDLAVETYLYVGEEAPGFADDYATVRDEASPDPVSTVPSCLDEAALMYTSGTTGRPKGCILTHDNLIQHTENILISGDADQYHEEARSLVMTPLFHIAAFGLFLINTYVGATTVLMEGFDARNVMRAIEDEAITSAFLVPTIGRQLLALEDFEDYDISSVENLSMGAAPSGGDLKARVSEAFDCDLGDAFGQTEMSPTTCVLSPEEARRKPDSVGRPLINVEVKVVDDEGEEVETGEVGRIAYRGPTVFQGYYEMPEKTAEVLDEEGWFTSDDLVRRDEEGFVYFVGRVDDMIISGGENIHPAEIEHVLQEHPGIREAAVLGVPDEKWGQRVKAVVVPEEPGKLAEQDVVAHVRERLAGYKQPREVVFLDELPRNPSGKVLKGELA